MLYLFVRAAAVGTTPATLITLDGNARCLDGSPAVYYVSKGAHSGTHKFYLYHQGGGWCQDQDECAERALTPLGSSLSYAPTTDLMTKQTHVFMSRNESLNWMHDWTLVYMPYCACMVVLLSFDSSHHRANFARFSATLSLALVLSLSLSLPLSTQATAGRGQATQRRAACTIAAKRFVKLRLPHSLRAMASAKPLTWSLADALLERRRCT